MKEMNTPSKQKKRAHAAKRLVPVFSMAVLAGCSTLSVEFSRPETRTDGSDLTKEEIKNYSIYYDPKSIDHPVGYDPVKDGRIHGDLLAFYTDPETHYSFGRWEDLSGNNRDLIQDSPTMQPSTTTFGSKSAISCDGIDDILEAHFLNQNILNINDGLTVVMIGQTTRATGDLDPNSGSDAEGILSFGSYIDSGNRGKFHVMQKADDGETVADFSQGVGNFDDSSYDTNGDEYIHVIRAEPSLGKKKVYADLSVISNHSSGDSTNISDSDAYLSVCGNPAYTDSRYQGKISALAIYNAPVPDERLGYLASWALEKYEHMDLNIAFHTIYEPAYVETTMEQNEIDDCNDSARCTAKNESEMETLCEDFGINYVQNITRCASIDSPAFGKLTVTASDIYDLESAPSDYQDLSTVVAKKAGDRLILALENADKNYNPQTGIWVNTASATIGKYDAITTSDCSAPDVDNINQKVSLSFNGIDQCLEVPDLDETVIGKNDGYTYIVVIDTPAPGTPDPLPSDVNFILAQGEHESGDYRENISLMHFGNNSKIMDNSRGRTTSGRENIRSEGVPLIITGTLEENRGSKKIYSGLDKFAHDAATKTSSINDNYSFTIGGNTASTDQNFHGKIGAVYIFDGALSPDERFSFIKTLKAHFGITYDSPITPAMDPDQSAQRETDTSKLIVKIGLTGREITQPETPTSHITSPTTHMKKKQPQKIALK